MVTRTRLTALAALVVLGIGAPASAQMQMMTMGVRGGVSADPKQVSVGFQMESTGLPPHPSLTFRPNVEVGFGSGTTLVSTNLDFVFTVQLSETWQGYFGGGPAVVYAHDGGNSLFGSYDGLVGFAHRSGLFVELKHTHGSDPGLRASVGFVFSRKK